MTFEQFCKDELGYECQTTFWMDFSIADKFGAAAIKDTFKRAFNEWKTNYIYLTELVLVLNHKIWQYHGLNGTMALLYHNLWCEADQWAVENLQGDELQYFYRTLD